MSTIDLWRAQISINVPFARHQISSDLRLERAETGYPGVEYELHYENGHRPIGSIADAKALAERILDMVANYHWKESSELFGANDVTELAALIFRISGAGQL